MGVEKVVGRGHLFVADIGEKPPELSLRSIDCYFAIHLRHGKAVLAARVPRRVPSTIAKTLGYHGASAPNKKSVRKPQSNP